MSDHEYTARLLAGYVAGLAGRDYWMDRAPRGIAYFFDPFWHGFEQGEKHRETSL